MHITEKRTQVYFDEFDIVPLQRILGVANVALLNSLRDGNDQDFGGVPKKEMESLVHYICIVSSALAPIVKVIDTKIGKRVE